MTTSGIIFNIQRFSTHDGPGIRTTVFLKGCPMVCLWCSNPESQSFEPQLMVRDVKCSGCGECVQVCPETAISFDPDAKNRSIDWKACNQCFECVTVCLSDAVTVIGKQMTPQEVVQEVMKDQVFYKNSGGGVTFSGGEILSQPEFLEASIDLAKSYGLHVTLDTTGFGRTSVLEKLLPKVDLFLFDLKHLDARKHKELTAVDNTLILKNLEIVSAQKPTWLRIPLVEGVNDDDDHITKLAELAQHLGVEKVSMLPFHEGGVSKISQIGMLHEPFFGKPPSEERMEHLKAIFTERGVSVTIGS